MERGEGEMGCGSERGSKREREGREGGEEMQRGGREVMKCITIVMFLHRTERTSNPI